MMYGYEIATVSIHQKFSDFDKLRVFGGSLRKLTDLILCRFCLKIGQCHLTVNLLAT